MLIYSIILITVVISMTAFMHKLEDVGAKWRREAEEEEKK